LATGTTEGNNPWFSGSPVADDAMIMVNYNLSSPSPFERAPDIAKQSFQQSLLNVQYYLEQKSMGAVPDIIVFY